MIIVFDLDIIVKGGIIFLKLIEVLICKIM